MEKKLELLTVVVASFSIITMNLSIMQSNKEVLKRLALNQKKIDIVKNLLKIVQASTIDVEKFLAVRLGYEARGGIQGLNEQLNKSYESEDTGF